MLSFIHSFKLLIIVNIKKTKFSIKTSIVFITSSTLPNDNSKVIFCCCCFVLLSFNFLTFLLLL